MTGLRSAWVRLAPYRVEALVFLGVFCACAWFYNGYGWNQTARFDPIWAFVEPGPHRYSFAIDDFVTDPEAGLNTGDWARNPLHSPHYYSNKAPGTTLIGVPFYLGLYHTERLAGVDPQAGRSVFVNAYLIHLWVTVLPVALSAVFFFHLALHFTGRRRRALALTGILYGGTLMLPFSTMLWGHTTAAAFVVVALTFFVRAGLPAAALCGLFVGLAVLTDYGAAPLAVMLTLAALAHDDRWTRLPALLLGALGPLIVFVAYHAWVFGAPFSLASSFSPAEMVDQERVLGLFGRINPTAVVELSVGTSRGLFFYMPVLLLSVYALRFMPRAPDDQRVFWWMAAANMLLVFLVNTTFNGWHAGMSTGPRYQIIALPFWILVLALLPERPWIRWAVAVLAGLSVVNAFVAAAVSSAAPDAFRGSALLFCFDKIWRVLRIDLGIDPVPVGGSLSRGSLHVYPVIAFRDWAITATDQVFARWSTFNLGERLIGLRGTLSLLPVLLGGAAVSVLAWREAGTERPDDEASPTP